MSQYDIELYKQPEEAAWAIAQLLERMKEVEAKLERLQRLNKLRDLNN